MLKKNKLIGIVAPILIVHVGCKCILPARKVNFRKKKKKERDLDCENYKCMIKMLSKKLKDENVK